MEMIITVVDSGSTDLVVDAAKAAGRPWRHGHQGPGD